jgi:hypothetical protein
LKKIAFLTVMVMNDAFRYVLHIGSHSLSLRLSGENIARVGKNKR